MDMKIIRPFIIVVTFILLIPAILINSCIKEEFNFEKMSDKIEWDPSVALPLAFGSITIDELISEKKDTIEYSEPDIHGRRYLNFVMNMDSLFSMQVADFLDIPGQAPVNQEIVLGDLTIDNFEIVDEFSLWEIVPNLDVSTGAYLLASHGLNLPFPPIVLQNAGIHDITSIGDFSSLYFSQGYISVSITNELPIDLISLEMAMKNKSDNSVIGIISFDLPAGSSKNQTINLAGKTMSNDISFEIVSMSSPGSGVNPILINLDNALIIDVSSHSLKVTSGEAIIPSQSMILDAISIDLSLADPAMKLTNIVLKDSRMSYSVHSPIPIGMTISLRMPTVKIDGNVVVEQIIIPQSGGTVQGMIDMSGAEINLASDPSHPYNRIPTEVSVEINGVGWFIPFDLSQGFSFDFTFDEIGFSLAQGYFGQIGVNIDETEFPLGLDFLSNLEGGFSLSNPSFNILAYSSLGIPIGIDLDVTGISSKGIIQNIDYSGPQMILPYPMSIAQGYNEGVLGFNKNNSSIDEIIGLPPETLLFSGSGESNPYGFMGYNNFITDTSQINIGLSMNFPITVKAENLSFQDTMALGSGDDEENMEPGEDEQSSFDFDIIEEASLYIDLTHDLPINLSLDIILFDSLNFIKYDTIHADLLVAAAYDNAGNMIKMSQHKEFIELEKSTISNFSKANSLIIKAGLSTYDPGDGLGARYVKLYSDYSLDFKLGLRTDLNFSGDN